MEILDVTLQVELIEGGPPLWTAATNRFHWLDHHGTAIASDTSPVAALTALAAELTAIADPKVETIKVGPLERVDE